VASRAFQFRLVIKRVRTKWQFKITPMKFLYLADTVKCSGSCNWGLLTLRR